MPGSTASPEATLQALTDIGVDFSVARSALLGWLNNPEFTPFPALAAALLNFGVAMKQPVFIDVISSNYEDSPGVSSPRRVEDVDTTVLQSAVVRAHNSRYNDHAVDFGTLTRPIVIDPADPIGDNWCGVPSGPLSDLEILTFGKTGGKWSHFDLKFSIDTSGIVGITAGAANVIVQTINDVFDAWTTVNWSPSWPLFTFRAVNVNSGEDIRVWFDDLPPKVLGVGGHPQTPKQGTLRLDKKQGWGFGGLFGVALHEVGHVLGVGHSDLPGSLMRPSTPLPSAIDPETQLALRTIYGSGWGAKITLEDRATSDRPALATTDLVNFTDSNRLLRMAWKGSRDDQGIYESEFDPNTNRWTPQRRILGRATSHSPAMASVPVNDGTPSHGLIMAWKGGDDPGLYYAFKDPVGEWSQQFHIPDVASADRPALEFFSGIMYLAWRGPDGDQGLRYSTLEVHRLSPQGIETPGWSPQQPFPVGASSTGPALVAYRDRLYMFWKGVEDDNRVFYSWLEQPGGPWQPQKVVTFADVQAGDHGEPSLTHIAIGSTRGPSATVRGDSILLAWKGARDDERVFISLYRKEDDAFSGQVVVDGVITSQGPCVFSTDGWTQVAWKGAGDQNVLHWAAWAI